MSLNERGQAADNLPKGDRAHSMLRTLAIAVWIALASSPAARPDDGHPATVSELDLPPSHAVGVHPSSRRVVHRFDFDERAQGNLEDMPKYWIPFRPAGFPPYARGGFDPRIGHDSAPSFHLLSEGRNVAFHYRGEEIPVRTNSEYRIEGFIRIDGLEFGRACLSAHFIDGQGNILIDSMVRSRYIGGANDSGWVPVELYLGAASPQAHSIGLIAWVVDEGVWDDSIPRRRHIPGMDVRGGAWFDDITVYRLPRVALRSSSPSNVLGDGEAQELLVELADLDDPTLSGALSIRSADGSLVAGRSIPVALHADADPIRLDVRHLPSGLYRARLDVQAQGIRVVSHELMFVRCGERLSPQESVVRSFGVVIDPRDRTARETELPLLERIVGRSVKVPVWSGLPNDSASETTIDHRFFQELARRNFSTVGVLHGPPRTTLRNRGAYAPSLLEFLETEHGECQEALNEVAAPLAGTFRWWQIGPDDRQHTLLSHQMPQAADRLRSALRPFLTSPLLAAAVSGLDATPPDDPVTDHVTIHLSPEVAPATYSMKINAWRAAGYERVSAFVDPLPDERFDDAAGLAQWTQRVIVARHSGADTVFVPQPWRTSPVGGATTIAPSQGYLALRTLADVIGDAPPGPRLFLSDRVDFVSFQNGANSILALWDSNTGGRRRSVAMQLGDDARAIDLTGQAVALQSDKLGREVLEIGEMPLLIHGASTRLIALQSAFSIRSHDVTPGGEPSRMVLTIDPSFEKTEMGTVRLVAPGSCEVWPREFELRVTRQEPQEVPLELRCPAGEAAGTKTLSARVRLSDNEHYFEVPMAFDLRMDGVDVWGQAVLEGDRLVLRHGVTNRSDGVLNLRSAASVPGRERQYRPFTNVQPGETQVVHYRYPDSAPLLGRRVMLGISELEEGNRSHNLELTVP